MKNNESCNDRSQDLSNRCSQGSKSQGNDEKNSKTGENRGGGCSSKCENSRAKRKN